MSKQANRPVNRAARREKTVRTPGYAPPTWTKWAATIAVLALLLMGMLAGVLSK